MLLWKPVVSILMAALVVGCTRGNKDESSSISFTLPERADKVASANAKLVPSKAAALSAPTDGSVLSHVVINVTGSGISGALLKTWDKQSSQTGLGSTFTIDGVPRGDSRLFQLLAVYENPNTKSMTIYYGDAAKSLSTAEDTVDITLNSISATQMSVDGHIFGRYLSSASGGPTADIAIKYNPPGGRPSMTIERTVMYNGWFSLFALSNVTFTYELQQGAMQAANEVLFGGPVSLHSAIFDPNENSSDWNRRSAAYIPFHARQEQSGNVVSWSSESASIYVWGFWGNAAAKADSGWEQRRVCRDALTGSLTRFKKYTPIAANQSAQPGLVISSLINFGLTPPADNILLDKTGTEPGSAYITFLGGETACPPGSLTAGDEWTKFLRVTKKQVDGNGNDSAAGFRGPFKLDANLNAVTVNKADPRVIIAKVLPGVAASVDEFRVFKRTGVNGEYRMDSPKCPAIAAGGNAAEGFSPAGSAGIDNQGVVTMNTSITAADVTAGVAAVICPYKGGAPYAEGLFVSSYNFQDMGGGNGNMPVATKLAAYFQHDPSNVSNPQVYNWTCVPLIIQAQDASGNPAMLPPGASIGATGTAADQFYAGRECLTPMTPGNWNPQWTGGPGQMMVYYRSERTGGNPGLSFSITAAGGTSAVTPVNVTLSSSDGSQATHMRVISAATNITAFGCYPVQYYTVQSAGAQIPAALTGATAWPGFSQSSDVQIFEDPGCAQGASGMPFGDYSGSQISHSQKYFSYRSMTSAPFFITVNNLSPLATADTLNFAAPTIPDVATRINVMAPQQWQGGQCMPVTFQVVDSSNRATPVPAGYGGDGTVQITVSGTTGVFYHSAGCSGSTTTTANIAPNGWTTQATLYFMPTGSGSGDIQADMTGSNAQYTGVAPITVSPEVATQFVYVFPGQTWNPGDMWPSGSAYPVVQGATIAVQVYAIKASNRQVDPTFVAGSGLTLNGTPPFTIADGSPFVAGVKTILVTFSNSGSADLGNPANYTSTYGLMMRPGYSSYYVMSVYSNSPQTVKAYMAGGYQPTLDQNVCQPVVLQPNVNFFAGTNYFPSFTGGPFVASSPLGSATMYSDDSCATPLTSGTIVNGGVRQVIVYTKFANLGYNSAGWNSQAAPYPGIAIDGYGTATPAGGMARFNIVGPNGILTGICQPFAVTGSDGLYNSVPVTTTVNLAIPFSDVGGQFFSDANCSSPTTSVSLANERVKAFYFKTTVMPPNGHGTVQINATDATYGGSTVVDVLRYQ